MKKFIVALVLVVMTFGTASAFAADNSKLTPFVGQRLREFNRNHYYAARSAYARPFAWGRGTYQGRAVEWFAYANTDAYFQLGLNRVLSPADCRQIKAVKDAFDQPYEASVVDGLGYIGTSNDWTDKFCEGEVCDYDRVTDYYLAELRRALPTLRLTTMGRLK